MAAQTTLHLRIGGMTCVNCQNRIERKLSSLNGVERARVRYDTGTVDIRYDKTLVSPEDLAGAIRELGYEVPRDGEARPKRTMLRGIGALLLIIALFLLMELFGLGSAFGNFRVAEAGMSYGMLLVIGLVTSVHCVAMCGGLNLSQCIPAAASGFGEKHAALRPSFLYNLGRVISYTVVGGIVGAVGYAVTPSGMLRGAVQLIAGAFMLLMGVNMLGIFPGLRRFAPRMPRLFTRNIDATHYRNRGPLYIGLLNGLMPCGPLQAMQLYALSTGSPVAGAAAMLLFGLGTVPLMFGLGALSSVLSRRFTGRMMTAGAVLVAVLGLSMFTQGLSLSNMARLSAILDSDGPAAPAVGQTDVAVPGDGVQTVGSTLSAREYPAITVQVGVPVQWTINAPEGSVTGCNRTLLIPAYDLEHTFHEGANVITFTPEETGIYQYTCWMGMIRSTITVV